MRSLSKNLFALIWNFGTGKQTVMHYAPTVYWYAKKGCKWNVKPDPKSSKISVPKEGYEIDPPWRAEGAIEGEKMRVTKATSGETEKQYHRNFNWSDGAQLWWKDAETSGRLLLEFESSFEGKAKAAVHLTQARDYGIFNVLINDQLLAEGIDLYRPEIVKAKLFELGEVKLKTGTNFLEFQYIGRNPNAEPRSMLGVDYLKIDSLEK